MKHLPYDEWKKTNETFFELAMRIVKAEEKRIRERIEKERLINEAEEIINAKN